MVALQAAISVRRLETCRVTHDPTQMAVTQLLNLVIENFHTYMTCKMFGVGLLVVTI